MEAEFGADFVRIKLLIPVFSQRPDRGGRPVSAEIMVTAKNPQTDESFSFEKVKVGYTRDGILMPTYVYAPIKCISSDGRLIVEAGGLGEIAVSQSRLAVLRPR